MRTRANVCSARAVVDYVFTVRAARDVIRIVARELHSYYASVDASAHVRERLDACVSVRTRRVCVPRARKSCDFLERLFIGL